MTIIDFQEILKKSKDANSANPENIVKFLKEFFIEMRIPEFFEEIIGKYILECFENFSIKNKKDYTGIEDLEKFVREVMIPLLKQTLISSYEKKLNEIKFEVKVKK